MSGYCVWRSTLQTAAPLQAICAKWKPSLGGSSAASLDLSCVLGWRSTLGSHICTQRFEAPTTVQCFKHVKFIETCTMHIAQFHFCAVSRGRQICYCGNFIQNVNKVTWASLQVLLSLALPGLKSSSWKLDCRRTENVKLATSPLSSCFRSRNNAAASRILLKSRYILV